ncbi:MAG: LPS export ABC transporter permease LptG [Chlorobium sp.]|nr:MAG: LPS export ABC transporter permease LptG [Chlorobium sp.]
MKILYRYIFGQFAKTFFFASLVFVCLFILITVVERLDAIMENHLTVQEVGRFFLLTVPATILITSPISSLLASILVSGKLALSSELPAIRSAGINMRQLLTPFLLGGLLILGMNIVNAWWIAPAAFSETHAFDQRYFIKNNSKAKENRNIHLLEPGNRIVSIGEFDPDRSLLVAVSIEQFSGARLTSRIDADSMRYDFKTREWMMRNASIRVFTQDNEEFYVEPSKEVKLALSPSSLKALNLHPDEMNIIRHYRYLSEKQKAGLAGLEPSRVLFHTKSSMPFASLIILLIGVPLSAKKKRGGLASEITISLFAGFLYLGLQKTVAMAGNQGAINPLLAAWLPNLLFLGIGYVIYKTAQD